MVFTRLYFIHSLLLLCLIRLRGIHSFIPVIPAVMAFPAEDLADASEGVEGHVVDRRADPLEYNRGVPGAGGYPDNRRFGDGVGLHVVRIISDGEFDFRIEIKEIRLGLNTDIGDFNTKVKHASRFIAEGDKVKVSIRFRGREMGHPEKGIESMERFAEACTDFAVVEKAAKMEGRHMLMFLRLSRRNK